MARESVPPAFDMAFRPETCEVFGPPRGSWVAPILYLVFAFGVVLAVEASRFAPQSSWLWEFFVGQDANRLVSARTFSLLLAVSALAAVLRTSMRGVLIHPDGIEVRGALVLGLPRYKRCEWVEIDRMTMEGQVVGLHLWNGSALWLPAVRDRDGLLRAIERVARLRSIPVRRKPLALPRAA